MITLGLRQQDADAVVKNADLITHFSTGNAAGSWWGSGWFSLLRESFTGAWQRGVRASVDTVLSHPTAWACITLIVNDIAKMPIQLLETDSDGISQATENPAYSPVLRRPNHYQNRIQFIKSWVLSKLTRGNTYVLKERDGRRVVTGLYVLDPTRVQVLVTPGGEVYYQLQNDALSGLFEGGVTVPASEIIHDIYVAPYHPLCGVSPIFACGMATMQGLRIIENSSRLFENGSQPSGVLTAPHTISDEAAARIQKHWDENFTGQANIGKVAVLGDGLKFEPMAVNAVDAQLIEQLHWGDEKICSTYHVPAYKVGVGDPPNYNNIEALNQQYYSQCLQILIEELELCLEEGLAVSKPLSLECDLDVLIRMDTPTRMKIATEGVKGTILAPNEGRRMFNRPRVKGGDTLYLQQQNYSIAAIARRDESSPAAHGGTAPASLPAPSADEGKRARRRTKAGTAADLLEGFTEELAAA